MEFSQELCSQRVVAATTVKQLFRKAQVQGSSLFDRLTQWDTLSVDCLPLTTMGRGWRDGSAATTIVYFILEDQSLVLRAPMLGSPQLPVTPDPGCPTLFSIFLSMSSQDIGRCRGRRHILHAESEDRINADIPAKPCFRNKDGTGASL